MFFRFVLQHLNPGFNFVPFVNNTTSFSHTPTKTTNLVETSQSYKVHPDDEAMSYAIQAALGNRNFHRDGSPFKSK